MKTNCDNCLNVISGQCVEYTGPDIACANIKNGNSYDVVVVELVKKLCDIIDANEVELGCLYRGAGPEKASIPEVIRQIIQVLCTLTTDNLPTTASLHCIGDNVSKASATIQNQAMTYSISAEGNSGTTRTTTPSSPRTSTPTTGGSGTIPTGRDPINMPSGESTSSPGSGSNIPPTTSGSGGGGSSSSPCNPWRQYTLRFTIHTDPNSPDDLFASHIWVNNTMYKIFPTGVVLENSTNIRNLVENFLNTTFPNDCHIVTTTGSGFQKMGQQWDHFNKTLVGPMQYYTCSVIDINIATSVEITHAAWNNNVTNKLSPPNWPHNHPTNICSMPSEYDFEGVMTLGISGNIWGYRKENELLGVVPLGSFDPNTVGLINHPEIGQLYYDTGIQALRLFDVENNHESGGCDSNNNCPNTPCLEPCFCDMGSCIYKMAAKIYFADKEFVIPSNNIIPMSTNPFQNLSAGDKVIVRLKRY